MRQAKAAVTLPVTFIDEHAIRQKAPIVKARTQAIGHRAQIFADHHAAITHTFQCDDCGERGERIAHVATVRATHGLRYPEQPRQRHHMINTQRPRATHVGREQRAKRREFRQGQCARIPRW